MEKHYGGPGHAIRCLQICISPAAYAAVTRRCQQQLHSRRSGCKSDASRKFIAQFTADNAATIFDKLTSFISSQKFDLAYPQSAGDTTLDTVLLAAKGVPADSLSSAALIAAIESATGKKMEALYAADAATQLRQGLWDRY